MTQTVDLIHKIAEFFKSEEFFEKGEDARLKLSPDDVRCMCEIIKACENAISRQAVFDLCGTHRYDLPYNTGDRQGYDEGRIINMTKLKLLPSVTTIPSEEPKTGHWIWQTEDIYRCSECGEDIHVKEVMNVPQYKCCPMCMARMVEPQENGVCGMISDKLTTDDGEPDGTGGQIFCP